MRRTIFEAEHDHFRESVSSFLRQHAAPHADAWEEAGQWPREFWLRAAEQNMVGFEVPEEYGGLGLSDFRFNAVIGEELAYTGSVCDGFSMANDILVPYVVDLTNDEQKGRWLPRFARGELVAAIAMTEPGAGSDLQGMMCSARRDGDGWVLNGTKTFVTGGIMADLVIVAARTDPDGGKHGFSLFAVESDTPGFERGRKLEKSGRWAQDTAELFFDDALVPTENLLGEEGQGFLYLMRNLPKERLSMAIGAVAAAEHALDITLAYVKERTAFGTPIGSFQANRFALAELQTKTQAARSHIDRCIAALVAGELTAAEAAGAKAWTTDLQCEVVDRCVQLHGGYGYMREYEISRLWRDARVQRIYGGTNEIMYEIVGRSLGL
jgi:acyl-CoA dehydrogenase